jgi:hypothetical protein
MTGENIIDINLKFDKDCVYKVRIKPVCRCNTNVQAEKFPVLD